MKNRIVLAFKLSYVVFLMLINAKMPTIYCNIMSMIYSMLSLAEHEKSFMTLRPELSKLRLIMPHTFT